MKKRTGMDHLQKHLSNLNSSQGWVVQDYNVTRLWDLLNFEQLFRPCGNNYFAQMAHILGKFL